MPAIFVFAIGLFEDLLRGTPFGAGPLALLTIVAYVRVQASATKSRPSDVPWLSFGIASLIAAIANWLALSFAFRTLLSPWPGVVQYLVTLAVFPLVAMALARLDRRSAANA
jgi:rod shape-determining protein MreD